MKTVPRYDLNAANQGGGGEKGWRGSSNPMPESSGHNPSTRVRTVCLSLHELCLATKTPLPLQAYAEKGASDPPPPPPSPPPAHRMKISKERFFTSSKRRTTLI